MKKELFINEILTMLPHGYPFILVDQIIDYDLTPGQEWLHSIKNVTINEPFFPGHFPTNPIMPAVLILEGLAQSSGLLMKLILNESGKNPEIGYVAGFNKARFEKSVIPGDVLKYSTTLQQEKRGVAKLSTIASVANTRVAYTTLLLVQQ